MRVSTSAHASACPDCRKKPPAGGVPLFSPVLEATSSRSGGWQGWVSPEACPGLLVAAFSLGHLWCLRVWVLISSRKDTSQLV